jgi:hypothetical protein
VVYVRCPGCMNLWSVVKPHHRTATVEPFGSFLKGAR